ncbi:MAG TPA: TRAM domain-containing protein, partial [Xanthomonadales bacterium]|nr:TRAM domain-containing protein [Xanthomonadales bacterium]
MVTRNGKKTSSRPLPKNGLPRPGRAGITRMPPGTGSRSRRIHIKSTARQKVLPGPFSWPCRTPWPADTRSGSTVSITGKHNLGRRSRARLPPEPLDLAITGLSHDGRGVAEWQGKKVFVHGALPGERAQVRLTQRLR